MVHRPYLPTKRLLCGNNPTLMLVLANHYVSKCLLRLVMLVSAYFDGGEGVCGVVNICEPSSTLKKPI
jgi:hypothetical protein